MIAKVLEVAKVKVVVPKVLVPLHVLLVVVPKARTRGEPAVPLPVMGYVTETLARPPRPAAERHWPWIAKQPPWMFQPFCAVEVALPVMLRARALSPPLKVLVAVEVATR